MSPHEETPLLTVKGPWGIPVRIAPSFLLLALFLTGLSFTPSALALVGMVLVAIAAHEFGHAWATLAQGGRIGAITLWGGGGVCGAAGPEDREGREFVLWMGPLTNLGLWAVSSLICQIASTGYGTGAGGALYQIAVQSDLFAQVNLWLFVVNMMPVQPLDGGRLLELALHRVADPLASHRVAGLVGMAFTLAWLPAMAVSWTTFGWVILFMPSLAVHWRMARARRA